MTSNKKPSLLKPVLLLLALSLISPMAMAATSPIEDALQWVLDLLTGGMARTAATIALAVMGYMAYTGRIQWSAVGAVLVGMVFLFGGAAFVTLIDAVV